jgi:ethanolamine utilization protein EutA
MCRMHDTDFLHEHSAPSEADRAAIARTIWAHDNVALATIGIDIGSSTSHLLFARVVLQRQSQGLSSRFTVVDRQVLWRSPIMLTPFRPDGTIDAAELGRFIEQAYRDAGLAPADIDSGAVILTGEAIKRTNARAIDELFAAQAGKFVCATAGHRLEARLAAHGSGAVRLAQERGQCLLHVDIGGGTTKLALIDRGTILGEAAFAVGGRLLATDPHGAWTRVDESARRVADALGLATDPAALADPATRLAIVRKLAAIAADHILDCPRDALSRSLALTADLARPVAPTALTVSGGVAEYVFGHERQDHGDIARDLAAELGHELARRSGSPLIDPGQRIRATVIGASQFTVQVSGKTIYLPDPYVLPVHNVPVVHVGDLSAGPDTDAIAQAIAARIASSDRDPAGRLALAFAWAGDPDHASLERAGQAIARALAPDGRRDRLALLMIDGDVGKSLGRLLHRELGFPGKLIAIDGVQLQDFDFVDVGELIAPPGVVPVVIKSLLFAA